MRWIALLTCLAFACATGRQVVPGSDPVAPPPLRVALAEPELDLWVEGTHAIDPAEEAQKLAQSREALAAALDGRGLDAPDPEALLVVRARAVARTEERKSAQVWSAVGIVFVVAVVIVTTVLLSRSHSSSRPPAARGVAPAPTFAPHPTYFAPRPYAPPPPVGFGLFIGLNVSVPAEPPPPLLGLPPTDAWLASRGWWDGDEVELSAELQDRTTGALRWHRTVRSGVDPRDPEAMAALVDAALADLPFGQRTAPAGPLARPSVAAQNP